MSMRGHKTGVLGLNSSGKSTIVNALLGENRAAIGPGETTFELTPYYGHGFTLWDFPGRYEAPDPVTEDVSLLTQLSVRLVVVSYTIKESLRLMRVLEQLNLNYDIVFNKFDLNDDEEREQLKNTIRSEVEQFGLKRVNHIYFLSAKYPKMFPDWLRMVNDLTD